MQVTVVNAAISCYCSFQCFWLCCSWLRCSWPCCSWLHCSWLRYSWLRYSWLHKSWLFLNLSPLSTSSAETSFIINWLCFYRNRPKYRYEHISNSHSALYWCILWVKNWYLGSEDRLSSRSKSSSASASFKIRQSTIWCTDSVGQMTRWPKSISKRGVLKIY